LRLTGLEVSYSFLVYLPNSKVGAIIKILEIQNSISF